MSAGLESSATWTLKKLGSVVKIRNGFAFKSKEFLKEKSSESDVPLIRQSQLKGDRIDITSAVYLPGSYLNLYKNYILKKGDIIVGMSGSIGKVCRYEFDSPALQNQRTGKVDVISPHTLHPSFLVYYLGFRQRDLVERAKGMGVQNISSKDIESLDMPLPSLECQGAIVEKIDLLMSELDKGIESLKTAREQLKVYRQAVLDSAFNKSEPKDATQAPLSELIGNISQGWSPKCELNRTPNEDEWAIIKTTALQPMQYMSDECKPLPEQFVPRPNIEIQVGDFLMTRKGPRNRTGVVCLVRETRKNSMLCDTVYRFRCNEKIVYPDYLELALNSPSVVAELDRRKSGISDSGISLNHGKVKTILIPIIGNPVQQRKLVESIREKLDYILRVESEIECNLSKSEALRQSILKKAFSGKIFPQDLSDEPIAYRNRKQASKDAS